MIDKYRLFSYEDELIANTVEGHSRWIVALSNEEKIYQDDFRQYNEFNDERRYSTWARLRDYCYKENLSIINLTVQFRTNKICLPEQKKGYYFCKSILGMFGTTDNLHFFVTGFIEDNVIKISEWKLPELLLSKTEDREINRDDVCLILGKDYR